MQDSEEGPIAEYEEDSDGTPPSSFDNADTQQTAPFVAAHQTSQANIQNRPAAPENQKSLLANIADGSKTDGEEEGEEDHEGWSATLTENIYSLIYAAKPNSGAFWFALFLFGFQASLLVLALVDLIETETDNPLMVPPDVNTQVRAAQFFAVTLAIPLFGDLLDGVEKLHEGYDPEILKQTPHATFWKWLVAFTLQFCVGALYMVTTFVLVVQSSAVIGMFLNFAALSFISEVDDVAFKLAQKGYVTRAVQATCDRVTSLKTPDVKSFIVRRLFFVLIWLGLMVGLNVIYVKQVNGTYQCKKVIVHFGDEFIPELPLFSGEYELRTHRKDRLDGRPVYVEVLSDGKSHFRYCGSEKAWVFNANMTLEEDSCEDWILKSPEDSGFDLTSTDPSSWLATRDDGRDPTNSLVFAVEYFTLSCNDSDESTCAGTCTKDNKCECSGDSGERYGLNCQFDRKPCARIGLDRRTSRFVGLVEAAVNISLSSNYEVLVDGEDKPVMVYGRPVYFHIRDRDDSSRREFGVFADILVNFGRRYGAAYFASDFIGDRMATEEQVTEMLIEYFGDDFHGFFNWIESDEERYLTPPVFVSDPLDYGTASDAISPVGLNWYLAQKSILSTNDLHVPRAGPEVDTVLVCEICDGYDNLCIWGDCNSAGRCRCWHGFQGNLCELEQVVVDEPWCQACLDGGRGDCIVATKSCFCNEGFKGDFCNETEDWCSGCDERYGLCDEPSKSCKCTSVGYTGQNCSVLADWCLGCDNGNCNNETQACECWDGYKGDKCTEVEPWCERCEPRGYCDAATETCVCYDGVTMGSTTCEIADWCRSCSYGFCANETCNCYNGFAGENCDEVAEWCKGCSLVGGHCNATSETCECLDGFTGDFCEETLPWCAQCPWERGYCDALTKKCECYPGYSGDLCEETLSWCASCNQEGSVCDGGSCRCDPGYVGEFCHELLPWCESCSETGGYCDERSQSCICNAGFVGENCENRLAWCEDCSETGGYCDVDTETCECRAGFTGENCDTVLPWCEGCPNVDGVGICSQTTESCQCFPGYEGDLCDVKVNRNATEAPSDPIRVVMGSVVLDTNGDNTGEEPMPGVTITLTSLDGNTTSTTATDNNGDFLFIDVAPAEYTVESEQTASTVSVTDSADYDGTNTNGPDLIRVITWTSNATGLLFVDRLVTTTTAPSSQSSVSGPTVAPGGQTTTPSSANVPNPTVAPSSPSAQSPTTAPSIPTAAGGTSAPTTPPSATVQNPTVAPSSPSAQNPTTAPSIPSAQSPTSAPTLVPPTKVPSAFPTIGV